MNFKLVTITFILSAVIMIAPVASSAGLVLDSAHYVINSDLNEINALELKLDYNIDSINSFQPVLTYHNQEIKLKGTWKINFLKNMNRISALNLDLSLTTPLQDISPEPSIGLSGDVNYLTHNKINLQLDYYLNKPGKNLVYHGGVSLPLSSTGELTLGFGNSYWNTNHALFDLGFKFDL